MVNPKVFKQWQRDWAAFRQEYLAGKLPVAVVAQVSSSPADGYRWECPECGEIGSTMSSYNRAETMGQVHVQTHARREDLEELENFKVLRMPEELLTRYQREKRDALLSRGVEQS